MGAAIVMAVCIGVSVGMDDFLLSLQIAIAFTGVWRLICTIAVMPWLEARPGPPLPKGTNWLVYSWSKNKGQQQHSGGFYGFFSKKKQELQLTHPFDR